MNKDELGVNVAGLEEMAEEENARDERISKKYLENAKLQELFKQAAEMEEEQENNE